MHLRRVLIAAAAVVAVASTARADEATVLQCDNPEETAMYKKQLKACEEAKRATEAEAVSTERSLRDTKVELETTKKMFQDVKKSAESVETANKQLTAELAASKAALDKSKEAHELKATLAKVEEENKELYESANQASRQLKKTKSQLEDSEEKLKAVQEERKTEAAKHKASYAKLNAEIEAHVKKHATTMSEMQAATRRLAELDQAHRRLEDELTKKTRVVYSAEIFWAQYDQVKRIFGAFGKLFKHRVIEILGADNLELLRLQTTIWFNKSCEKASALMAPMNRKVTDLYKAHAEEPMRPYLLKGRRLFADGQQWTKEKVEAVGRWSEGRMDRLVYQLSMHDPSVRQLFPDQYWDRLACFAFLFGIAYVLSELVQWVLSTFVFSPISYCILGGGSKSARKSGTKKSGQKSAASAAIKKGPLATKTQKIKPEASGSAETATSETDLKGKSGSKPIKSTGKPSRQ